MSAPLTLYSVPLSMFGAKAEIAAREKGLRFELVMVPFAMATLYSPKHPEVERINPKRQVPVLVHRSNGGPDLELFDRSEEHTSELQSLMRISYAVFCLKKKKHASQQSARTRTRWNARRELTPLTTASTC